MLSGKCSLQNKRMLLHQPNSQDAFRRKSQ
uniref:Uncharacterized protein n=1 Tax=Arundo donax TaxID=35708 RepID=A0A0A9V4S7_ARUDO